MELRFKHLSSLDFSLLYHCRQASDAQSQDANENHEISYILGLVKEKNSIYDSEDIQVVDNNKSIYAFVIYTGNKPIGYIEYYNAYDFLKDEYERNNLPKSLAAFKVYLSDDYILKDVLELFLKTHVFKKFNYALATLSTRNLAAISGFEQAGFRELKISNEKIIMLTSKKIVRMSTLDLMKLEITFRKNWLPNDSLWIFGSRADLSRKGGDIDIYIETHAKTVKQACDIEQKFKIDLINKIGEQKIDVVLNMLNFSNNIPIHEFAKAEGVKII